MTHEEQQRVGLAVLDDIVALCDRHGLTYYLAYGTLIGAMRHEGFIPWDDDVDIMMPRADYERFLEIFDAEKDHDYLAVSLSRFGNSRMPYAKVVDTRTLIDETYVEQSEGWGVWVDIFPLDFKPLNAEALFRRNSRLNTIRWVSVSDPSKGTSALARAVKKVVVPMLRYVDPVALANKIEQGVLEWGAFDEGYYVDLMSVSEQRKPLKREWFDPVEVTFEGKKYLAPSNYDEVLKPCYGDWRQLPPEEERAPHSITVYWRDKEEV